LWLHPYSAKHQFSSQTEYNNILPEVFQNHSNENVRNIGQGEANHRKYKRLKLGGGQAHDRSSV
jgi:hypothetical protein